MLVTTGPAEGQAVRLDGREVRFWSPHEALAPAVSSDGRTALVGRQRVTLSDGNLRLETRHRP